MNETSVLVLWSMLVGLVVSMIAGSRIRWANRRVDELQKRLALTEQRVAYLIEGGGARALAAGASAPPPAPPGTGPA